MWSAALALFACTPPDVAGTLVDVRGAPLSGVRVIARPVEADCPALESDVVDGAFAFGKPCRGDYALSLDDPDRWLLVEPSPLPATLAVRAWPVPAGAAPGVYVADDAGTRPIPAIATARELPLLGKSDVVRFPDVLPEPWPEARGFLVVVGEDVAGLDAAIVPLVDAPARRFGAPELPRLVPAWKYFGAALPADGEATPVDATLGEACTADVVGDVRIAGCPVDAIAPRGDYAVRVGSRWALFAVPDGGG